MDAPPEQTHPPVRRPGIAYLSRHGDDIQNWATFEPATPEVVDTVDIAIDDPDLTAALSLHGLRIE